MAFVRARRPDYYDRYRYICDGAAQGRRSGGGVLLENIKLMIDGTPSLPFSAVTLEPTALSDRPAFA